VSPYHPSADGPRERLDSESDASDHAAQTAAAGQDRDGADPLSVHHDKREPDGHQRSTQSDEQRARLRCSDPPPQHRNRSDIGDEAESQQLWIGDDTDADDDADDRGAPDAVPVAQIEDEVPTEQHRRRIRSDVVIGKQ
jgi:hypothetical protein